LRIQSKAIALSLLCCSFVLPVSASIISLSGVTVLPSPPASVQLDQLQSNTTVYAFQERNGSTLGAPLLVDVSAPGSYNNLSDIPLPSSIPAGTVVNSYYLSADPDLALLPFKAVSFPGLAVTFSPGETVIGIQFLEPSLLLGSVALGAPGTAYPPPPVGYGLELTTAGVFTDKDTFSLSADRRTVSLNLITGSGTDTGGVDQVRIITSVAPVPEPGTVFLLLSGASCLAFAVSRRNRS
jgi:hypothetical protein